MYITNVNKKIKIGQFADKLKRKFCTITKILNYLGRNSPSTVGEEGKPRMPQ
jgi:hypothetical protein